MVYYINGNLLEADVQYICHQVNCQGKMGSGVAKQIKEKFPVAYEDYMTWYRDSKWYGWDEDNPHKSYPASCYMLGNIRITPINDNQNVIHMAAQNNYGYDGEKYTSYDMFWCCLEEIQNKVPKGSTIGFPDHIGSDRGGANWEVVRTMIEEMLGEEYDVCIYKYEGK